VSPADQADAAPTPGAETGPDRTATRDAAPGGRFGPATWTRALVLALAFAVLGGSIGYAVGSRDEDPDALGTVDVGYLRDMFAHHLQAVQMSMLLLYKPDVSREAKSYAMEIFNDQRLEQGIFNALLARGGYSVAEPDGTAMGWMGAAVPVEEMTGMATEDQIQQLRDATGRDAEALYIALMTEHHLGGMHMSDYASRHADHEVVRNYAKASMKNQRGEVIDLDNFRRRADLPRIEGFEDPRRDPRLNPAGLAGD